MYKLNYKGPTEFYLPGTNKVFVTNFLDEDLELYQQAIVGMGGQIEKNRPEFPRYNEPYPWTLFLPHNTRIEFWEQFKWMKEQKEHNVEYWWIKE